MKILSLLTDPRAVREAASTRTDLTAVFLNGISGVMVIAALSLPMQGLFTPALLATLAILFGPLAGFIISSLYVRVEYAVGRRFDGKASLDEQYRLFAWSFFPSALAVLLYGLCLMPFDKPSAATQIIPAIPVVIIFCCAVRNYCSNVMAAQQFTRRRGIASAILSVALFLLLVGGCIGYLWLFSEYGCGKGLKAMFGEC